MDNSATKKEVTKSVAIGQTFGSWTVICDAPRDKGYRKRWMCRCKCGKEKTVDQYSLTSGDTTSCGCANKAKLLSVLTTHGRSKTKIYSAWRDMKNRCERPKGQAWKNYGGRGITVCERWSTSFENFFNDMGDLPFVGAQLDRIDNTKGYYKENCRWATRSEQVRNTRVTPMMAFQGDVLAAATVAEKMGVNVGTFNSRRSRGWSDDRIISQPIRQKKGSGNGTDY